jgi:hypothetical protein
MSCIDLVLGIYWMDICVRSGVVRLLLSYTTLFFDMLYFKEEDLMNGRGSLR